MDKIGAYIKRKAKKLKLNVPDNWKEIINKLSVIPSECNTEIKYTADIFSADLLSMQLQRDGSIQAKAEWAAHLVLYNTEEVKNTFLVTVGHELTHAEKDNSFLFKQYKRRHYKKFINWIDEVYADFGGVQKMGCNSRKKLISAIDYKIINKKQKYRYTPRSLKDGYTHPSWQRRRYYAENFNFNEQLIRQVAEDTGCKDEQLIQQVCDYYKDIMLV